MPTAGPACLPLNSDHHPEHQPDPPGALQAARRLHLAQQAPLHSVLHQVRASGGILRSPPAGSATHTAFDIGLLLLAQVALHLAARLPLVPQPLNSARQPARQASASVRHPRQPLALAQPAPQQQHRPPLLDLAPQQRAHLRQQHQPLSLVQHQQQGALRLVGLAVQPPVHLRLRHQPLLLAQHQQQAALLLLEPAAQQPVHLRKLHQPLRLVQHRLQGALLLAEPAAQQHLPALRALVHRPAAPLPAQD